MNLIRRNKKLSLFLMALSFVAALGLVQTPEVVKAKETECVCAERQIMGVCEGATTSLCSGGLGCPVDVCGP